MRQIIFSIIAVVLFTLNTMNVSAQTPSKAQAKQLETYTNLESYMQGFMTQAHSLTKRKAKTCGTVSKNSTAKTITITFNNGCTTPDGKSITGTLTIGFVSGQVNSVRSITATNLVIDGDFAINGRWEMAKAEVNSAEQLYCTATFAGTVTINGTSTLAYSSSHTLTWIDGTAIGSDAKIEVTGEGTFTNNGTVTYASSIKQNDPLLYDLACLETDTYVATSGTIVIDFGLVYTFDFGDGACDNLATYSFKYKNKRGQTVDSPEVEVDMTDLRNSIK